jgi:hypothetical protein
LFTSKEIKQILQKRIDEKKKEVRPDLLNQRYVEQIIMELETLHSILTDIDEEERTRTIIR